MKKRASAGAKDVGGAAKARAAEDWRIVRSAQKAEGAERAVRVTLARPGNLRKFLRGVGSIKGTLSPAGFAEEFAGIAASREQKRKFKEDVKRETDKKAVVRRGRTTA